LWFLVVSITPLAVVGVIAFNRLNSAQRATDEVGQGYLPAIIHLSNAEIALLRVAALQENYVAASDEATLKTLEAEIDEQYAVLEESLRGCGDILSKGPDKQTFQELQAVLEDFRSAHRQVLLDVKSGKNAEAQELSAGAASDFLEKSLALMGALRKTRISGSDQARDTAESAVSRSLVGIVGAALGAMVVVSVLAFIVSSGIARPVLAVTAGARKMADGDLDQKVQVSNRDETGLLAQAFNQMAVRMRNMLLAEKERREGLQTTIDRYVKYMLLVAGGNLAARVSVDQGASDDPLVVLGRNLNELTASLQEMIVQTREAANDLSAASVQILSNTTQQAASAGQQSAAIAQTTATVSQVKTIAEQSVGRARQVANTSQRTVEVSRSGRQTMQQTIASMAQIKTRVEGIAENILALSEQTQQIGEIISTVNDIAAQSNMLALNASIEAARAGEHGKGFAVVAVEVRNLAEQSRQATAQVKAILSDIQRATNATVMATEEGAKGVDEGVRLAGQAQEVIEQLAGAIDESAQVAMQMVVSGEQQASGVEQIALAMEQIYQATTQGLSGTQQTEEAAQELNALAQSLSETVQGYQL
jgi:methyl-accepting chemotaxis protein